MCDEKKDLLLCALFHLKFLQVKIQIHRPNIFLCFYLRSYVRDLQRSCIMLTKKSKCSGITLQLALWSFLSYELFFTKNRICEKNKYH